jgi:hypothetical protein
MSDLFGEFYIKSSIEIQLKEITTEFAFKKGPTYKLL